ncbi:MAG: T9SS type A sorting domain-containing protein [Bacteroidetes bacterium]|nr:T9SS type A sorting domain-containing protein [Bacteroidota bacterium]
MMKTLIRFLAITGLSFFLTIASNAQSPGWLWAKSAGGTSWDWPGCVATDASGNAYVTGYFSSPAITFGSITLTNITNSDFFLVKYGADGNVLWAKNAGDTGFQVGYSVVADAAGNVYVAGMFDGPTLTFGSDTLTNAGNTDMFLVKYDEYGNVLWARSAGGPEIECGYSVAKDALGHIYVTGYFASPSVIFGPDTLTNVACTDIFLVKYDSNGNVIWAKSAGDAGNDNGCALAVDAPGNAYVTGNFNSPTLTFGSWTLATAGEGDFFLVKYDANGNVQWAKSAGGTDNDEGISLAVDVSGNPYASGQYFSPEITFGSYALTNAGIANLFLVKYDGSGNVLWAKSAGGTFDDRGNSVSVDTLGNSYIAGYFGSPNIVFGPDTLTNAGSVNIFLASYDPGGTELWAKSAGGTGGDVGNSVAVDASGNAFVTGVFESPVTIFGSDTLTLAGAYDIYLAKSGSVGVGTNRLFHPGDISLYPNPSTGEITIAASGEKSAGFIAIVNLEGQEFLKHEIKGLPATIDVSSLPGGVYFLKLTGERSIRVKKFVKIKAEQ